ncbi:hypothetical protein PMLGA01_090017200 [Plasmodium malariae]|uniref:Uncharacterized protein n=1 Tax=Plasmodium malariae TaxID=5858 RepID=A0A1C3KCF3_PLAMA|nr:hypothetical protein PMLGA01_090017200 [Plasmodium malariae]
MLVRISECRLNAFYEEVERKRKGREANEEKKKKRNKGREAKDEKKKKRSKRSALERLAVCFSALSANDSSKVILLSILLWMPLLTMLMLLLKVLVLPTNTCNNCNAGNAADIGTGITSMGVSYLTVICAAVFGVFLLAEKSSFGG